MQTVVFSPSRRTEHTFSGFLQQDISLPGHMRFAVGSKFEHNSYSGFEAQPTGLLIWTPNSRHTLWGSVSRAVRTPSRVETDLAITKYLRPFNATVPLFVRQLGDSHFGSEKIVAYEAGYRVQPTADVFIDATAFLNDHSDLLSLRVGTAIAERDPPPVRVVVPLVYANGLFGKSHGAEVTSEWRHFNWWRLVAGYSYLRMHLKNQPNSMDLATAVTTEGSSPHHQTTLQSYFDLPRGVQFDWIFRHVSALPGQSITAYTTADARIGWRPVAYFELSIAGRNLLEAHHAEFTGGKPVTELKRNVYVKGTWAW
jgi:iron complex outermembrane recepter protein